MIPSVYKYVSHFVLTAIESALKTYLQSLDNMSSESEHNSIHLQYKITFVRYMLCNKNILPTLYIISSMDSILIAWSWFIHAAEETARITLQHDICIGT